MKQLQLELNKRLFIVELHKESEYETKKDGIFIKLFGKYQTDIIKGNYKLICKGSDLTEDIARGLVESIYHPSFSFYKDYNSDKPDEIGFHCEIKSFISAIESKQKENCIAIDLSKSLIFEIL